MPTTTQASLFTPTVVTVCVVMTSALLTSCAASDARDSTDELPAIQGHQFQTLAPAVILNCREAIERLPSETPDVQYTLLVEGCNQLYRNEQCRDAWVDSTNIEPGERAPVIARACRQAYCPVLRQPKPEMCQRTLPSLRTDEISPTWVSFLTAVLAHDLGSSHSSHIARLYTHTLLRVSAMPATEAAIAEASPKGAVVSIRLAGEGQLELSLRGASIEKPGTWTIEDAPTTPALSGLIGRLQGLTPSPVVIMADPDVRYESLVRVLDAMRAAGFDQFELAVAR